MKSHNTIASTASLAMLLSEIFATANAGLFDDPQNLKVLPKDITPKQLSATMRGFAINTGSRCSTCHVGKIESDLSTYDFSLDEKEKKQKARTMIRLVDDITVSLGFLRLKLELYPESAQTLVTQGQVQALSGDVAGARASYARALEIEPENKWTQRMLDALE